MVSASDVGLEPRSVPSHTGADTGHDSSPRPAEILTWPTALMGSSGILPSDQTCVSLPHPSGVAGFWFLFE